MRVDTVIVGSGTAGLSALREVRRHTEDFLVINRGHWGTTCAAVGCMPSKILIESANAFHIRHRFNEFGIRGAENLQADVSAVLAHVRKLRDDFVKGPASTPAKLGERAVSGCASLNGPNCVVVNGEEIEARSIILTPGSRPVVPEAWQVFADRIFTSDTIFEQRDLPQRIAVVGMGSLGVEFAQALARLGLTVAGFDESEKLAGIDDPDVAAAYRVCLEREVQLHLGATADLTEAGGAIQVRGSNGSFQADVVLAALGRRPNIEGLGLDTLGVPLDDDGLPEIDPTTLRIGEFQVFLAGDANGYRPLLHEAADEGHIAGRNSARSGNIENCCRRTPLTITFSSPQIARVGTPLSKISEARCVTAEADFSRQARARMAGTAAGLLRIHADRDTCLILGAEMCAPAAEHLAHLLALAIEHELTVADMLAMPVYHPVVEEGLRGALRDLARALHVRDGSDLSACEDIGHEALD